MPDWWLVVRGPWVKAVVVHQAVTTDHRPHNRLPQLSGHEPLTANLRPVTDPHGNTLANSSRANRGGPNSSAAAGYRSNELHTSPWTRSGVCRDATVRDARLRQRGCE